MTLKQRRKEAKQEKQKDASAKKENGESSQLLKVVVAFIVVIAVATAAIYFVGNVKSGTLNESTSEEKKEAAPTSNTVKDERVDKDDATVKKEETAAKNSKVVTKKRPLITNKYDKTISDHLKDAEKLLKNKDIERAKLTFESLVKAHPDSPRSMYGLARSLDELADLKRSNEILQEAIGALGKVGKVKGCPKALKRKAAFRQAERLAFLGNSNAAATVLRELSQSLPDDIEVWNKLGVQYLIKAQNQRAMQAFNQALTLNAEDGFALVHLGFVLKAQSDYEGCIPFFEKGLATGDEGTDESKFYFHLGDAYYRLGHAEKAYAVYERGAKKGHFLSAMQRSLYNADTPLRAKPFWKPDETPYLKSIRMLEQNWETIRDEALSLYDPAKQAFVNEEEGLRETGTWQQFTMFQQGRKDAGACAKTPKTCKLVENIHDAARCKRGQIKFSVMKPGTHIWAHCGPTNCRIRGHLGLVIPNDVSIRVANEKSTWQEGKMIIIDDSIDHEVWHNGTSFRMIMIIDFWHPDLTSHQKNTLSPI